MFWKNLTMVCNDDIIIFLYVYYWYDFEGKLYRVMFCKIDFVFYEFINQLKKM